MAYRFDATNFDATDQGAFTTITIGFNLIDDTIVDPVQQIVGQTSVSMTVRSTEAAATAKTIIATNCSQMLQDWYNVWTAKRNKVINWLTSNEVALETYVNSHVTF